MENTRMTVGQFVDAAVGHRFVIARSVKGVLGYSADGDGIVYYYGDRYNVPARLRSCFVSCWAGDCVFKNEEYNGSILILLV